MKNADLNVTKTLSLRAEMMRLARQDTAPRQAPKKG